MSKDKFYMNDGQGHTLVIASNDVLKALESFIKHWLELKGKKRLETELGKQIAVSPKGFISPDNPNASEVYSTNFIIKKMNL